jgi:growth arrest-specific protein 8
MKEERIYHTDNDKNMLKDKKQYKDDYQREDHQHQSEIETQINKLDQEFKELDETLDFQRKDLISKYDEKLKVLKAELELRRKVEVHEIEERKNQHINELCINHEEAFREMKDYYNDITKENLELIRMYKEKCIDIKTQTEQNEVTVEHLKLKMKELRIPLSNAVSEKESLSRQLSNYKKDIMALQNAKARLAVLKSKEKECK